MKRLIEYTACLTFIIASVLMVSCSNANEAENASESQDGWHTAKMRMNITKAEFDGAGKTRSVDEWSDGAIVYLLFTGNNGSAVEGNAVYRADDGEWTVNYYGTLNRSETSKVEAYYFDSPGDVTTTAVALNATTGVYKDANASYAYPSGGELTLRGTLKPVTSRIRFKGEAGTTISVGGIRYFSSFNRADAETSKSVLPIDVTVQENGYTPYIYGVFEDLENPTLNIKYDDYSFSAECPETMFQIGKSGCLNIPMEENYNGWMYNVPLTGISLSVTTMSLAPGASGTLTPTFTPSNASFKDVTWTSSNTSVATVVNGKVTAIAKGTAKITATSSRDASIKATCSVTVLDTNGHAFVDLGLPSGILWATCNVGATKAEDYGDYYAWGETSTKSTYTSSNYTYSAKPTTLPLTADVAHVKWGGNWRMPTSADIDELINNCTTTWTTQNGVNGRKVTSKTNGNSIFLPAAGYFTSSLHDAGSDGDYWSSSLYTSDTSSAYYLYFGSSFFNRLNYYRYGGQSVRPVFSK